MFLFLFFSHLIWTFQIKIVPLHAKWRIFVIMQGNTYKIVYCIPALYMAGGMERVLTLKANYFADYFGYDVTVIITEGLGKPLFYPLSPKVKVINLCINFEELLLLYR